MEKTPIEKIRMLRQAQADNMEISLIADALIELDDLIHKMIDAFPDSPP